MVEIERKFLVDNPAQAILSARHSFQIFQGYISHDPARTVRLRIGEGKGFLTIKGASSADGTTRLEWEQEIPLSEAKALMPLCLSGVIQKTRHHVVEQQQLFEVDVFEAAHIRVWLLPRLNLKTPRIKYSFLHGLEKKLQAISAITTVT